MRPPTADLSVESTLDGIRQPPEPRERGPDRAHSDHCTMVNAARGRSPVRPEHGGAQPVRRGQRTPGDPPGRPRPAASSRWSRSASTACPAGRRSWPPHVCPWPTRRRSRTAPSSPSPPTRWRTSCCATPPPATQVMKQVAGVISTRLRDIKEELIEVLESLDAGGAPPVRRGGGGPGHPPPRPQRACAASILTGGGLRA